MTRLTKNNKVIRDEILTEAWKNYKNRITMKDLAEIFQIDLSRVYQILTPMRKRPIEIKKIITN